MRNELEAIYPRMKILHCSVKDFATVRIANYEIILVRINIFHLIGIIHIDV